jgi:hypothetical protein
MLNRIDPINCTVREFTVSHQVNCLSCAPRRNFGRPPQGLSTQPEAVRSALKGLGTIIRADFSSCEA